MSRKPAPGSLMTRKQRLLAGNKLIAQAMALLDEADRVLPPEVREYASLSELIRPYAESLVRREAATEAGGTLTRVGA